MWERLQLTDSQTHVSVPMNVRHAKSTFLEGETEAQLSRPFSNLRPSDVLFRHCKGHAQNALNRVKSNELQNHSEQHFGNGKNTPHAATSRDVHGQTSAATSQIREDPSTARMARESQPQIPQMNGEGQFSHLPHSSHQRQFLRTHPQSPGEDRIEALINAAQHLEPGADTPWRTPSPMVMARTGAGHMVARHPHESMGPLIDPANDVLSFPPVHHVSSLDQWAFDLVQSNNPTTNRTPADALQTWLFPMENDTQTPHDSHQMAVNGFFDHEAFRPLPDNEPSPSGSSVSIASRVPRERFQRVQSCWPSRNRSASRLMPHLWPDLIMSDCSNILSEIPSGTMEPPLSDSERRTSRWGLDEECRNLLQDALHNAPARPESCGDTVSSSGDVANTPIVDGVQFPPAEILDIALEMYISYFHPTLPIIHIPTFSAKHAPRPLLLCMCLIGLSILGTAGAAKFVTRTFPAVLQLALTELQSLSSTTPSPHQHMRIIATSLLALNLASITGVCQS